MLPKRARLKSFGYTGLYRYFLTFCTRQRFPAFTSPAPVDLVLAQFRRAALREDVEISAYVFMPDHVHLLLAGRTAGARLREWAHLAKQCSGYRYARTYGRKLWQPSYYDRVLREGEADLPVMAYILENPVRAGLAGRPEDYPFLGCVVPPGEVFSAVRDAGYERWRP